MATEMTQTAEAVVDTQHESAGDMIVSVFAAMLLGFGVTLLGISAAYVRDLETLQRIPESVWLFVCGVPTEDPIVLPLMITLSVVAMVLAGALIFIDKKMPNIKKRLFSGKQS